MRTLAIDLGAKRIGLALSDQAARLATPYDVLQVSSPQNALEQILRIIRKESPQRLLLGLPLNMDGTLGPQAQNTIAWARTLSAQSDLPILFVDERLTSFAAEQSLIARKRSGEKITRKRKKAQLDALAAAAFLQEFLDRKLAALPIDLTGAAGG